MQSEFARMGVGSGSEDKAWCKRTAPGDSPYHVVSTTSPSTAQLVLRANAIDTDAPAGFQQIPKIIYCSRLFCCFISALRGRFYEVVRYLIVDSVGSGAAFYMRTGLKRLIMICLSPYFILILWLNFRMSLRWDRYCFVRSRECKSTSSVICLKTEEKDIKTDTHSGYSSRYSSGCPLKFSQWLPKFCAFKYKSWGCSCYEFYQTQKRLRTKSSWKRRTTSGGILVSERNLLQNNPSNISGVWWHQWKVKIDLSLRGICFIRDICWAEYRQGGNSKGDVLDADYYEFWSQSGSQTNLAGLLLTRCARRFLGGFGLPPC